MLQIEDDSIAVIFANALLPLGRVFARFPIYFNVWRRAQYNVFVLAVFVKWPCVIRTPPPIILKPMGELLHKS